MKERWILLSALVALSSLIFFWRLGSLGFFDPDEGMYAEISREMLVSHDWVTPHFNYVRYLEKPPLFFWLTALTYTAIGQTEFTTRLPLALAAIGGVIVTYLIGKKAFDPRAGFLSGIILATSIGYFVFARIASTDVLFSFFLALTFLFFILGYSGGGRVYYFLFYLSMGLGVLTKGLIGLILPFLVLAAFVILTGEFDLFRKMELSWGIVILVLVTVPWHLLVAMRNPGFLWFYLVDNQFLRFLGQRAFLEDDVPLSTPAFLAVTLVWFSPWSAFLPAAFVRIFPRKLRGLNLQERLSLLIFLWLGVVLAFFSFSSSKLEHYALPAFPAFALCVGKLWGDSLGKDQHSPSLKAILFPLFFLFLLAVILFLGISTIKEQSFPLKAAHILSYFDVYYRTLLEKGHSLPLPPFHQVYPALRWLSFFLLLSFGTALLSFRQRLPLLSFGTLILSTIFTLYFVLQWLTLIEPYSSVKILAQRINLQAQPWDLVVNEGPLENSASLPFYTGRRIFVLNGEKGDLEFGSRFPEAQGFFINKEDLLKLWAGKARVFFVTDSPSEASSLRILPPGGVHLLGMQGNRRLFSNRD